MSIAMDRFGLNEQGMNSGASDASPSAAFPYRLQCRGCGFEPENAVTPPHICPKCSGSSWERFAAPRSLLIFADSHPKPGRGLTPIENQ